MKAALVCDGTQLIIPESMGQPKKGQLSGSMHDNLGELCSRICYDSLGKGRSSIELHNHIKEIRNHSIYEHINITVNLNISPWILINCLINRKGIWIELGDKGTEVTANMRALLEWDQYSRGLNLDCHTKLLGDVLKYHAHQMCPLIIDEPTNNAWFEVSQVKPLDTLSRDQAWVSMYLYGSRGFTHEQVRHRFAMSQRSTRYVDESDSDYIIHPLITQFLDGQDNDTKTAIEMSRRQDRYTYDLLVKELGTYLESRGMDRTSARKQARGAARGFLGNALASEMIFSAPVSGWLWMLNQRKNRLADAEIREIYTFVLEELQQSIYGHYFSHLLLVPSPDGIGTVLL